MTKITGNKAMINHYPVQFVLFEKTWEHNIQSIMRIRLWNTKTLYIKKEKPVYEEIDIMTSWVTKLPSIFLMKKAEYGMNQTTIDCDDQTICSQSIYKYVYIANVIIKVNFSDKNLGSQIYRHKIHYSG